MYTIKEHNYTVNGKRSAVLLGSCHYIRQVAAYCEAALPDTTFYRALAQECDIDRAILSVRLFFCPSLSLSRSGVVYQNGLHYHQHVW